MEFPYPTTMANCDTCHRGKLDRVLANTNFKGSVCKTCHAVEGIDTWGFEKPSNERETYWEANRAPALAELWANHEGGDVTAVHAGGLDADCTICHGNGISRSFNELHTGYNEKIYTAAGQRYADLYTVSIDDVSLDGDELTVEFSSNNDEICPELLVSFYGWDTKHFLIPAHQGDSQTANAPAGCGSRGCRIEHVPASSASDSCPGGSNALLFTEAAGSGPGAWSVTLDMAAYQAQYTDSIPDLIASGKVKKAEITITPELEVDGVAVAINATTKTFDLNAGTVVDNYFKDDEAVVETAKCDVCHDSLATTFHEGSGRGGGGIQVCKNCHNPTFAGSHLETQSRSIESYVHGIHSFQAFDPGDAFGPNETFDPVFAKRYDQHIKHVFPNFTIRNCEACHKTGTASYNVPDQYESLYGLLSGTDAIDFWYEFQGGVPVETEGRKVGTYPQYVTGPAARTCGSCHRARFINQDEAGELASIFEHHRVNGTVVERPANDPATPADEATQFVYDAITKIQELLQ
jgi:OmcA/MtrC family decaheme c-type cytochrome